MKKGFTLIELLAVIVILSIIALIATLVILGIINNVKEEVNKRSVDMYAKAIENAVATNELNSNKNTAGSFNTQDGENLILMGKEEPSLIVDYDGNVVCDIIEIYYDGLIYLSECKVDGEQVEYTYGIKQSYINGQIVFFDIKTGKSCTNYHEDNSKTGYNGLEATKTTDNQNSCLKFYAFNDDFGIKINLLLDHNTTAKVAWKTTVTETNTDGPVGVIDQLKKDTDGWNAPIISKNYEYKGVERPYTISYNTEEYKYKARLIEANEVAQITGAAEKEPLKWKEESSTKYFYLDGERGTDLNWQTQVSNSLNPSNYYWLFDRTNECTTYGCKIPDNSTYGYWTGSAHPTNSKYAWYVRDYGCVDNYNVSASIRCGVRPVIEVLKSSINNTMG